MWSVLESILNYKGLKWYSLFKTLECATALSDTIKCYHFSNSFTPELCEIYLFQIKLNINKTYYQRNGI